MKKSLFLTAAFAVALMSCSKNETVEINNGKGITFRAFTDLSTRASDVTTDNLSGFHLYALQDGSTAGLAGSSLVWQDDYTVSKGSATGGRTHYWPGDGSNLYFFGYNSEAISASKVVGGTVAISGSEQKINGVKPATKAAEQKDLVVTYQQGNKTNPGDNAVQMNFIHAFSKITVSAKNTDKNLTVKVLGVRIYGVNNTAALTLPTTVTDKATVISTDGNWSPNSKQEGMTTSANKYTSHGTLENMTGAKELTESATSIMQDGDKAFMLLPQQLSKWTGKNQVDGAYIAVLCQATQSDGNGGRYQLFPETAGKYGWTAVAIGDKWEPGKAYNYVLDFSNGGGTIPPKDDEDKDKDPVDPNPEPGEEAWGGAIKINVTVTGWGNAQDISTPMN